MGIISVPCSNESIRLIILECEAAMITLNNGDIPLVRVATVAGIDSTTKSDVNIP